jgi:membrane-associated protease RseP (regulator of RpoE activity)
MTPTTPQPAPAGRLAVRPSPTGWRVLLYAVVLALLLAVIGWVSTHPGELATTDTRVQAETPVATPVYLGVFGTPADFDRTLHISGVRVFATASSDVTIVPHVCHGGSVNVTTTPETFCAEFGPTEGATLESGDEIVLEVLGEVPTVVEIDRVRIAYRDGLQWATQDAGARARVSILAR